MPVVETPPPSLRSLPEPYEEPLDLPAELRRLGGRNLLGPVQALVGDGPVYHAARSRTGHDVGLWWRSSRIWVFATAAAICLGAWGRGGRGPQPLAWRCPYRALRGFLYNDVTGELLLRPADPGFDPPGLVLLPLDGYQFLAHIRKGATP